MPVIILPLWKIKLPQFSRSQVNCIARYLMGYQAKACLFLALKWILTKTNFNATNPASLCFSPFSLCVFHAVASAGDLSTLWWSQWMGNGFFILLMDLTLPCWVRDNQCSGRFCLFFDLWPESRWGLPVGRCCTARGAFLAALFDRGLCNRHKSSCWLVYLLGKKKAEEVANQCRIQIETDFKTKLLSGTFWNISGINMTVNIQQFNLEKPVLCSKE